MTSDAKIKLAGLKEAFEYFYSKTSNVKFYTEYKSPVFNEICKETMQ